MEINQLGIMVVNKCTDRHGVSAAANKILKVGETYVSDKGYSVYKDATTLFKLNAGSCAHRYLEVRVVSKPIPVVRNGIRFFLVQKIEILREVPREELLHVAEVDVACFESKKIVDGEDFDKHPDEFCVGKKMEKILLSRFYRILRGISMILFFLWLGGYYIITRII